MIFPEPTKAPAVGIAFDWIKGVPQHSVFTASVKIHNLKVTAQINWSAGWTDLFDRGYLSLDLLTTLLNVGAHFVIRLKQGVKCRVIERYPTAETGRVFDAHISGLDGAFLRTSAEQQGARKGRLSI